MFNISNDAFMLMINNMFAGTLQTINIFFLTIIFSVPLGFLVALCRMSHYKFISMPIRIYQLVMRGTPLMLQLLFIYFGPSFMFQTSINKFLACIITFVLNYAAYFSEIFRSGIESIPQGQYEAAKVLGYTKNQTFMRIILPQVIKRVIPPTGSEFMTLVKDTALAQVISVDQLFIVASTSASRLVSILPYIIAAIFYLIMNTVVEFSFKKVEKRLDYYK